MDKQRQTWMSREMQKFDIFAGLLKYLVGIFILTLSGSANTQSS